MLDMFIKRMRVLEVICLWSRMVDDRAKLEEQDVSIVESYAFLRGILAIFSAPAVRLITRIHNH